MESNPVTAATGPPPEPDSAAPVMQTRVDGPHRLATVGAAAGQEPGSPDAPADDEPGSAVALLAEMRTQASQLAEHLQRRQAVLDLREAELNGRLAAFEQQWREARRWFTEQQEELEADRAELQRRRDDVDASFRALSERQAALDDRQLALHRLVVLAKDRRARQAAEQAESLRQQQREAAALCWQRQQLEARREELLESQRTQDSALQARSAALEAAVRQKHEQLQSAAADLQTRLSECARREQDVLIEQRRAQRAAASLAAARVELRQRAERLAQREGELTRQQHDADQLHERRSAEHDQQQDLLRQRHQRLEAWEAQLRGFRDELRQAQADTLQMRLVSERLLSQLSDAVPPQTLARSIRRLRSQLTEHYRLMAAELEQQRQELETLRTQLDQQRQALERQDPNRKSPTSDK